jgi:C4-type Zn-finger protein
MNNYDYPLGTDTKSAPWHEMKYRNTCPNCGSDYLELHDVEKYKNVIYENYICMNCGYIIDNTPNYDDYE